MRNPHVVVIGAGMTGILMAIKLKQAGVSKVTILEKKDKVGGTWRENIYPGIACDVPSQLYSYSFEPSPEWSQRFAPGAEIQAYFERVSAKYGITEAVRFNECVELCHYDAGKWTLKTSKGETIVADFVVCATGILHQPAMPDIDGLESFSGPAFHSAQWDTSANLAGKNVGIVGTGSTAAQIIPELAETVKKLTIFQRSAHWIIATPNETFTPKQLQQWRDKPKTFARMRAATAWVMEHLFSKGVVGKQPQRWIIGWIARRGLKKNVPDPVLRAKITPDYEVGCKRVVISDRYYPAIQRDNVALHTDGIEKVVSNGVVDKQGQLHELDALVLATGFRAFDFMRPMDLRGRGGISIDTAWQKKIMAYRSLMVPEFPNFFLMLGPYTPIGNFSVIAMSEVQADYVLQLIDGWRRGDYDAVEPTAQATQGFAQKMKAGLPNTVWMGGCKSWYLDDDGDPVVWPYTWKQWVDEMRKPDLEDFTIGSAA